MMIEIEDQVKKAFIEMIESDLSDIEKVMKYNLFVDFICDALEEAKQILESAL